jgi:hypothetical protein
MVSDLALLQIVTFFRGSEILLLQVFPIVYSTDK